jgi:hypothetical protein
MIVRMATAYTGLASMPGFHQHVIVSIHLRNPRLNGFPSCEEAADLEALEKNVCRLLEAGNDSLCVLVITNNGLRDLIFHTRDVEGVQRRIEDAVSRPTGFEIEFWIEPDQDWQTYRHFCHRLSPVKRLGTKT